MARLDWDEMLSSSVPGALGGLVIFLLAVKNGRARSGHRLSRAAIEIVGGAATAACLSTPLVIGMGERAWCFFVGAGWAGVATAIQSSASELVRMAIGRTKDDSGGGAQGQGEGGGET